MPRELSEDEVKALGLDQPAAPAPRKGRELSTEEAAQIGLPAQPAPPPPAPPEKTGRFAAVLEGAKHGLTSGFSDEVGAAGQVGLQGLAALLPNGALDWAGIENRYSPSARDLLDTYRSARGENREIYERADRDRPGYVFAGDIGGGLLQPGPAGKKEAGGKVLRKALGKAAKTGAITGGIDAIGDSKADLTKGELSRALFDAGFGTALGSALGPGSQLVGHVIKKPLARVGKWLEGKAAQRAAQMLSNTSQPIQDNKLAIKPEVGLEALKEGGIVIGGTMQGALERLQRAEDRVGQQYADVIEKLKTIGVKGFDPAVVGEVLERRGKEVKRDSMIPAEEAVWEAAAKRLKEVAPDPVTGRWPDRLELDHAERLKQSLTKNIDWGKIEDRPANIQKKAVAALFRQSNEEAIEEASARAGKLLPGLKRLEKAFKPVKQKYGRLAQATEAAEKASNTMTRSKAPPGPVEVGAEMAFQTATGGVPSPNALKKLWQGMVKERGPSTAAAGAYEASKLANSLAERPGHAMRRLGGAVQRASNPTLDEAFWEQFVPPPPPPEETEDERRIRELRETLYPHGKPP